MYTILFPRQSGKTMSSICCNPITFKNTRSKTRNAPDEMYETPEIHYLPDSMYGEEVKNLSIKCHELTGSPIRQMLYNWISGITNDFAELLQEDVDRKMTKMDSCFR